MDNKSAYYSSHSKLPFISTDGQDNLEQHAALVVGAGGLGCPCLLALAGAGIGTIGIADVDTVSISNLHRQPLYQYSDAGKYKSIVAASRLGQYNPFINIVTHNLLIEESNVLDIIAAYDVIVDCTDNFSTRYLINDACVYVNKPLVYGAIHQSEGHVTVFNYKGSPALRCLFPNDENDSIASCADIGAYNITTGIIGNLMANEVIKIIVGHGEVLAGKLKQLDLLTGAVTNISYQPVDASRKKSLDRFEKGFVPKEISPLEFNAKMQQQHTVIIDVRETEEHLAFNIGGSNIPLMQLLESSNFPFGFEDEIIVYCQKGNRSKQAIFHLKEKNFTNAMSLQGGIELYLKLYPTLF